MFQGGIYLGCEFGLIAMLVWGVGIFAAGQSSTMTGTYTGQFVMEGFVKIQWPKWKRVIITRAIAITPTLILTFYSHVLQDLTGTWNLGKVHNHGKFQEWMIFWIALKWYNCHLHWFQLSPSLPAERLCMTLEVPSRLHLSFIKISLFPDVSKSLHYSLPQQSSQ